MLAVGSCGEPGRKGRPDAQPLEHLQAQIASVEAGRGTTPLIGPVAADGQFTVTFLAKSDRGATPRIVSDVTGWGESVDGNFDFTIGAMRRVGDTGWYSLEAKVAARARVEYLVAYGLSDYRADPFNPRHSDGPQMTGAPASEFTTPGYQPPPDFTGPPVSPTGTLSEVTVESRSLRRSCSLTVYTPPGYREDRAYPLAVFSDLGPRRIPRALDWLIAQREIAPVVAVFALPDSRGRDFPSREEMRRFLADELPKWMSSRYAVSTSPRDHAVLAVSFGARDALHAALSSPEAYRRLGLLIPGRRISADDVAAIRGRAAPPMTVAILAGQYDRANLPTARNVRQALLDAGHSVDYFEVPEGHSAVTFHHHLREILVSLFPGRSASQPRS